jgi:tetratricopeptide (TPR) repeat protein
MRLRLAVLVAGLTATQYLPASLAAQAPDHVAMGDREHAAHNLTSALQHYEAAIKVDPTNYIALVKAAHDAVDLGEFNENRSHRDSLYHAAEQWARRAVAANPTDAEGHFELARAIGRNALTMGTKDKIKYAGEVRDQAMDALKINPTHAGALHVMGVWNAEVMRLNGFSRMIARNFLGGKVFGEASWDNAQRYMEQAVAQEPNRITHHLDLASVYVDRGDKAKAIEQYQWIGRAAAMDYNDSRYKEIAAEKLKSLQ